MPDAGASPDRIYLDHAATTPVRDEVRISMEPYLRSSPGNPSSLHAEGRAAREALELARATILEALGADDFELVFTSGGTEADNSALVSAVLAGEARDVSVVASAVEHPAVLNTAPFIERLGARFVVVGVDEDGRVDVDQLRDSLDDSTAIVSVLLGGNETGALQPTSAVSESCRERGVLFHTDAVQCVGKSSLSLAGAEFDLVTISAHKVEGPKGVGALLVRRGVTLHPSLRGGAQEGGRRAGTENVAGAVGFAEAVRLAMEESSEESPRRARLRDRLLDEVLRRFPGARSNTPADKTLPHILNVSFPGVEGESLVKLLDHLGVAASTGSACNVGSRKLSHVLRAMGRSDAEIRGSLRISLGRMNDDAQADLFLDRLARALEQLQRISGAGP